MAHRIKQSLLKLKPHRLLSLCLAFTLLFFIHKGITYALIGSFEPLLVILAVLGSFLYSLNKSPKAFVFSMALWSVLIILWSLVRLLLSLVNLFIKPIPEGHVDAQLGLYGMILSAAFLFAGVYIWKNRYRVMG